MKDNKTGLDLLRKPFEKNLISKLPKPTKKQTDDLKADFKIGIRCKECGGWHHKDVVHLDYVGHAALTDRLLDCDPAWDWQPMSLNQDGWPKTDANGGMWIKLTVCGISRLGYGHADGKQGGDAIKETIGDALRNAAMRFGAALDLWHKGDLHEDTSKDLPEKQKIAPEKKVLTTEQVSKVLDVSHDIMNYRINAGPKNKITGTLLTDHTPQYLYQQMVQSQQYHNENKRDPHPNTKELWNHIETYLRHVNFEG